MTTTKQQMKEDLLKRIQGAFSFSDVGDITRSLQQILDRYSSSLMKDAQEANDQIESLSQMDDEPGNFDPYYLIFEYLDEAKDYATLFRDVVHELVKAHVFKVDELLNSDHWDELKEDSHSTLNKATTELFNSYSEIIEQATPLESLKKFNIWKHQKSPWPAYKKYLDLVLDQTNELCQDNGVLQHTQKGMITIADWIKGNIQAYGEDIEQSMKLAEEVLVHMESEDLKPKKLVAFIKSKEDLLKTLDRENSFNTHVDNVIGHLDEKLLLKVNIDHSKLITKDINFQRQVKQYVDSEIRPVIYEFWELAHDIQNNLKMAFLNVHNNALLISNEEDEGKNWELEIKESGVPLKNFIANWTNWKIKLKKHRQTILERIEEQFLLSKAYDSSESFLPIPFQSSLNQLKLNQSQFWTNAKNFVKEKLKFVEAFRSNVAAEEALSESEKIVRYIEEGSVLDEHQNYAGIFLTKGYLGSSFWVGRDSELKRLITIHEQWLNGYRGSVLLSGNRFCGKSLFGDHVCNTYLKEEIVRLTPKHSFVLGGRTFTTTSDLGEALANVKKFTLGSRAVVWIDDLELWSGTTHPLAQNARILTKYIDELSSRVFFIVATTDWVVNLLSELYNFKRVFQAQISLRYMSREDIQKAILIRHGATHKTLADLDGSPLPVHKLQKALRSTVRAVDSNIGDALNYWTSTIQVHENEQVKLKERREYRLPDFLRSDISLILKTIILNKKTNDYHLHRLFGDEFGQEFKRITQRLISVGILKRNVDGWLEINQVVVNELARRLEDEMFLNRNQ